MGAATGFGADGCSATVHEASRPIHARDILTMAFGTKTEYRIHPTVEYNVVAPE
jgi:hypothetical protein